MFSNYVNWTDYLNCCFLISEWLIIFYWAILPGHDRNLADNILYCVLRHCEESKFHFLGNVLRSFGAEEKDKVLKLTGNKHLISFFSRHINTHLCHVKCILHFKNKMLNIPRNRLLHFNNHQNESTLSWG